MGNWEIEDYNDYEREHKQVDMIGNLNKYLDGINQEHFEKYIKPIALPNKKQTRLLSFKISRMYRGYNRSARLYKITYYYKIDSKSKSIITVLKIYFAPYRKNTELNIQYSYFSNIPCDTHEVKLNQVIQSIFNDNNYPGICPEIYFHDNKLHCIEMQFIEEPTLEKWLIDNSIFLFKKLFQELDINKYNLNYDHKQKLLKFKFILNHIDWGKYNKIFNKTIREYKVYYMMMYSSISNKLLNFNNIINIYQDDILSQYVEYYHYDLNKYIKEKIFIPKIDYECLINLSKKGFNSLNDFTIKMLLVHYKFDNTNMLNKLLSKNINKFKNQKLMLSHGDIHPMNIFIHRINIKNNKLKLFPYIFQSHEYNEARFFANFVIFNDFKWIRYQPYSIDNSCLLSIFDNWLRDITLTTEVIEEMIYTSIQNKDSYYIETKLGKEYDISVLFQIQSKNFFGKYEHKLLR